MCIDTCPDGCSTDTYFKHAFLCIPDPLNAFYQGGSIPFENLTVSYRDRILKMSSSHLYHVFIFLCFIMEYANDLIQFRDKVRQCQKQAQPGRCGDNVIGR